MRVFKIVSLCMFVLVALCTVTVFSYAGVVVENTPHCTQLTAGQFIDAGDVCVKVEEGNLIVTYTTHNGWELTAVHLWVGDDLADMPHNAQENPKIGNFPYKAEDLGGVTSYSFNIPLTALGGDDYEVNLCDQTFLVAAHASVQKPDGAGGYQTETGWGDGPQMNPGGSWAMYFDFMFKCVLDPEPCETPPAPPGDCDTPIGGGIPD